MASIEEMGRKKLQKIEKLEKKFGNNLIEFSPADYRELVLKNPRPYDVVMVFNVDKNCEHCENFESEYKQVVYSFVQERGVTLEQQKEKLVFFGVIYFKQDKEVQEIFKGHNFVTVPYLAVSTMDPKREAKLEGFFKEEDIWLVSQSEVYDAQKQIDYLNNHLKTDVKMRFTFSQILVKNVLGMLVIAALFSIVNYLYQFLLNQWVWFIIAVSAQVVFTGGLVYSLLNNMPWFKFERNEFGNVVIAEYFMRGQRGQWAGEGYIVSVLVTFTGLVYLYMNNVDKMVVGRSN
mmetsp:Transcript_11745/g.19819  ORF Transcript_11745/g.19819 Transcript_11745/m.19819 type:complete len:290 (-) Transcript_11745:185-1054(-)